MQTGGYGYTLDRGEKGQKADIRPDVVMSYSAEGAVDFGKPVEYGANKDKQCKVFDDNTFLGIALFTHTVENDGTVEGYADKDTVSVLTSGAVFIENSQAGVSAGDKCYVTPAAEFTNVDGGGDNTLIGHYLESGGENDILMIELD